jgi:hypothetical protein
MELLLLYIKKQKKKIKIYFNKYIINLFVEKNKNLIVLIVLIVLIQIIKKII